MSKGLIESKTSKCQRLFLDEIGRASRDLIEALSLGHLIENAGKRMIGASDGLDSDQTHSKQMLTAFAMLHEWFVDQLRKKVFRGMRDAFGEGKNIRPPALGYKLVPKLDADGKPLVNAHGRIVEENVIDEATEPFVEEAFLLFVEKNWSPLKLARRFNDLLVKARSLGILQALSNC